MTEENEPIVPFHWVEATVNVTVKHIPEEAVDKSGSIRFVNITAAEFIVAERDVRRFITILICIIKLLTDIRTQFSALLLFYKA